MRKENIRMLFIICAGMLFANLCVTVKVSASEHEIENNGKMTEEIIENFWIDCEFKNEYELLSTYCTVQKDFDTEQIENLMWPEKGNQPAYFETYDGGASSLSWNDETVSLNKGTMRYFKDERTLDLKEIVLFAESEKLLDVKEPLTFSGEKAIQKADKFLKDMQLGTEYQLNEFFAINSQKLNELQKILKQNPDYQYFYDIGKLTELQFEDDDEIYYLKYRYYLDGVPVYSSDVPPIEMTGGIDAPTLAEAMEATFLISEEDICYISLFGMVEKELTKLEERGVITYDEVKESLINIYGDVILPEVYTITNIEMEYIPMRDVVKLDEIKFVPAWCCEYHIGKLMQNDRKVIPHAVRIHATTGERIS